MKADKLSAKEIIDILKQARELNLNDPYRKGNVIYLPNYGQVVMTGDLHGYEPNFEKIKKFADLGRYHPRHIILHELIHAPRMATDSEDCSCRLLIDAAIWKIQFPEQVHFILGNHDLAQITGKEILKNNGTSISAFNQWIEKRYQESFQEILEAINEFLLSLPLAVKTPNRIMLSHSLPQDKAIEKFDLTILERNWKQEDLLAGGSVYEFVWGRKHSLEGLAKLSELFDVKFFIVGHQRQEEGCFLVDKKMIILASDHPLGCFITIDLAKDYSFEELTKNIYSFYQIPTEDTF